MGTSLKNTIRTMHVEACQFRPAGDKTVHTFKDKRFKEMNAYSKDDMLRIIREIMQFTRVGRQDVYKLRLVYVYRNRKTNRKVKVKRSMYFYVAGRITSKEEALDQFDFSSEMQKQIAGFGTEQVFMCHYEVEPVVSENNYDYLSFVGEPKRAMPRN